MLIIIRFKIGSQNFVLNDVLIINPRLASRSLLLDFKNPWRILAETPVASLCDAQILAKMRILNFGCVS